MKLLDKFKNMFTDEVEEDDDIKVEQIKNEVTHVSIESPVKIEKEEEKPISKLEELKRESKPIFFDEKDFNDFEQYKEEIKPKNKEEKFIPKKEENIYKKEEVVNVERKIFKPTPIISPVYGILDKNYHKEDIVSRTETVEVKKTKEPTVDTIRNKAYGTLEDELENTLFGDTSILFKKNFQFENEKDDDKLEQVDDDVLSNLTDDISKELDELLIKKEKYIDEENNDVSENDNLDDEDLLGFIDSTLYKKGDE